MAQRNGIVKDAWMHMLKDGGRWTAAEIKEQFGRDIHATLNRMAAQGYAVQFGDGRNRVKYGVTPDCKVPIGVTINDLQEIL